MTGRESAVAEAIEAEWFNGNLAEDCRDRLLAILAAPPALGEDERATTQPYGGPCGDHGRSRCIHLEKCPDRDAIECRWCPTGCPSCEPEDCECYRHQNWTDKSGDPDWPYLTARAHQPTPPEAENVALSVWSNTCNAYCDEEDRVHAPECLLAADLHNRLTARPTPPEQAEAVAALDEVERRITSRPYWRDQAVAHADLRIVRDVRAALTPTAATQVSAALAVAQAAADKALGSGGT